MFVQFTDMILMPELLILICIDILKMLFTCFGDIFG